jgi:hypothetical protein
MQALSIVSYNPSGPIARGNHKLIKGAFIRRAGSGMTAEANTGLHLLFLPFLLLLHCLFDGPFQYGGVGLEAKG